MTIDDFLQYVSAAGSLLTGIGTLALAFVGNQFVQNKQFEHKFDLAKEAVKVFNHLKNDLQQIRSPFGYEGEIKELEGLEESNDLIASMKKYTSGGLVFLRMNKRGESLAHMNRLEPEFKAVFGDTKAFESMRSVRHEIYVAAQMICSGAGIKDYSSIIYSFGKDDELSKKMQCAVEEIEKICSPVLKGK